MMTNTELIQLQIPRSPRFVVLARKTIDCIGTRLKLTEEEMADMKLAVGEACSNAVKFSDPASDSVNLLYRFSPEKLEIEVRNKGAAFDASKRCEVRQPLCDITEGGFGLSLIEKLVDEMQINIDSGEITLKMVKRLPMRQ